MAVKDPTRPEPFEVFTEQHGDSLVVAAAGELDVATAQSLTDELRRAFEAGSPAVTLDLSQVEFIDSTGLRALLTAMELSGQSATRFGILRRLTPAVERALEVSAVENRLSFID